MVKNTKKSGKKSGRAKRAATRRDRKLVIAIIGAGRLGTALGLALNQASYRVEVVVGRTQTSARRAAKLIGKQTAALTIRELCGSQSDRLSRCDLILISTPDDAIASVVQQLVSILNSRRGARQHGSRARRVTLHTSGALSAKVLSPLRRAGFVTGSLHPLVSISDSRTGPEAFRHAFFAIEGDRLAVGVARSIVRDLGARSFSISPNAKALYHAAAVMASGHVVALFDIALEMLTRCGFSRRRSRQILMPLLESTTGNLSTKDPTDALTGTFARGDVSTAKRHLVSIKSRKLRDALAAYIFLGQRSLSLAKRRGENPPELDQITEILSTPSSKR